jgi:hypothetical protein
MTEIEKATRALYSIYRVKLQFSGKVAGGIPKDPSLIESWVKARTGYDDEETRNQIENAKALTEGSLEDGIAGIVDDAIEKNQTIFLRDEEGPYLEARCVKACFRDVLSIGRVFTNKKGSKQIYQHAFVIKNADDGSDRIYLDGGVEGIDERPIHVMTARGPRTAIKRMAVITAPFAEFEVWVLKTHHREARHLTDDDIRTALLVMQHNGLGASRSQGYGQFELLQFDVEEREKETEKEESEEE